MDDHFSIAIQIHRKLVDVAREFQMLQDNATLNGGSPESVAHDAPETNPEEDRWKCFVENESKKR